MTFFFFFLAVEAARDKMSYLIFSVVIFINVYFPMTQFWKKFVLWVLLVKSIISVSCKLWEIIVIYTYVVYRYSQCICILINLYEVHVYVHIYGFFYTHTYTHTPSSSPLSGKTRRKDTLVAMSTPSVLILVSIKYDFRAGAEKV